MQSLGHPLYSNVFHNDRISTAIYVDTGSLNKDFLFSPVPAVRSSYNNGSDSAETRLKKRRNVFALIYSKFMASGKQLKWLLTVLTSLEIKTFNITGGPNALVEMFSSLIVKYARGYNSFLTHVFNCRNNLKASQFEQMTTLLKENIKNAYHNRTFLRLIAIRDVRTWIWTFLECYTLVFSSYRSFKNK